METNITASIPPEPGTEFDHKLRGTHRQSPKNTEQTCNEPECEALESPKKDGLPEYTLHYGGGANTPTLPPNTVPSPYVAVYNVPHVPIIIGMPDECPCSCHREKARIRKIMELLLMHAFLVTLICGFVLVLI